MVTGITPERRSASEKYIKFLTEKNQQVAAMKRGLRPAASEEDIQLDNRFHQAYGTAKIKEVNFLATPNVDTINTILRIWSGEVKKPSHLAIVFDHSGSMNDGNRIASARSAATQVVNSLSEKDWVSVYQFSSDVQLIATNLGRGGGSSGAQAKTGLSSWLSSSPEERFDEKYNGIVTPLNDSVKASIGRVIQLITAEGGTMIKDALVQAANHLCQERTDKTARIKAIILLTDGVDDSRMPMDQFVKGMTGYTLGGVPCVVPVFSVAYEAPVRAEALLTEISAKTKGAAYKGDKSTIQDLLSKLADFM